MGHLFFVFQKLVLISPLPIDPRVWYSKRLMGGLPAELIFNELPWSSPSLQSWRSHLSPQMLLERKDFFTCILNCTTWCSGILTHCSPPLWERLLSPGSSCSVATVGERGAWAVGDILFSLLLRTVSSNEELESPQVECTSEFSLPTMDICPGHCSLSFFPTITRRVGTGLLLCSFYPILRAEWWERLLLGILFYPTVPSKVFLFVHGCLILHWEGVVKRRNVLCFHDVDISIIMWYFYILYTMKYDHNQAG